MQDRDVCLRKAASWAALRLSRNRLGLALLRPIGRVVTVINRWGTRRSRDVWRLKVADPGVRPCAGTFSMNFKNILRSTYPDRSLRLLKSRRDFAESLPAAGRDVVAAALARRERSWHGEVLPLRSADARPTFPCTHRGQSCPLAFSLPECICLPHVAARVGVAGRPRASRACRTAVPGCLALFSARAASRALALGVRRPCSVGVHKKSWRPWPAGKKWHRRGRRWRGAFSRKGTFGDLC